MTRASIILLLAALAYIGQPAYALINLPLIARQHPDTVKRSNPGPKFQKLTHEMGGDNYYYSVEIKIGKPPQALTAQLMTADSKICGWRDVSQPMCLLLTETGTGPTVFHLNESKTLSGPQGRDVATYGDPTTYPPSNDTMYFELYKDKFEIANTKICSQTFGVLDEPSVGVSVGLGPDLNHGYEPGTPYNTVLDSLAAQDSIPGRAFSVDLRPFESTEGK